MYILDLFYVLNDTILTLNMMLNIIHLVILWNPFGDHCAVCGIHLVITAQSVESIWSSLRSLWNPIGDTVESNW